MVFLRPSLTIIGVLVVFFSVCCFVATQITLDDDVIGLVEDNKLLLFDMRTRIAHELVDHYPENLIWMSGLTWSPDGRFFIVSVGFPTSQSIMVTDLHNQHLPLQVAWDRPVQNLDGRFQPFKFAFAFWPQTSENMILAQTEGENIEVFYEIIGLGNNRNNEDVEGRWILYDENYEHIEALLQQSLYPSPDGQYVIEEDKEMDALLLNGRVIYALKANERFSREYGVRYYSPPAWSLDGRKLLFTIYDNRTWDSTIMRLDIETFDVDVLYKNGRNPAFRPRVDD